MVKTLTLDNPLTINGIDVRELTYDTNEITALHFAEADAHRQIATAARYSGKKVGIAASAELDYTLHLYLGVMAVIAVNPQYAVEDLERVKGDDTRQLMGIGRNFMLGKSVDDSTESDSDKP